MIERFRKRNEEAEELETELAAAREHIAAFESMVGSEQTRVEPVDPDDLKDGMDASNDPIEEDATSDDDEELISATELENIDTEATQVAEDAAEDDDSGKTDAEQQAEDNGAPRDDLKMIKGVGPAIEKTLYEMGICRFNQIADMSEYDIDRVAHRLKGFRSRIYREDWIGQARDLHDQKVSGQQ